MLVDVIWVFSAAHLLLLVLPPHPDQVDAVEGCGIMDEEEVAVVPAVLHAGYSTVYEG